MDITCNKKGERIPLNIRTDKNESINFIKYFIDNNIKIENDDIYSLASWCGCDIDNLKCDDMYSEIENINYIGEEQTYDLSIEDGNSFVSNGIICHNTVNLPNDVTEELVSEVYITGWKSGCKGLTVYRDGSRSGVLISKSDVKKSDIFKENNAPKRPKSLPCDIIRFTNKGEKWIGFLGLLDNRPYEIFTGLYDKVGIPLWVEKGEIVKTKEKGKESKYDFIYYDKDGYQQEFRGLNRAFSREFWNVGRLLSGILRHGMPLPNVMGLLDKLDFGETDITSWQNGIKRMIKKYVKDGTKVTGEECPSCHSHNMVYKEGCLSCLDCSWSKCS